MIVIVMGVSGSGKSTIGEVLAQRLGWHFYDADDFHSDAAKDKMKQGIPLNDADRKPWLHALQSAIENWLIADENTVLACSALKSTYRQILHSDHPQIKVIYLKGSWDLISERLKHRQNHFMKENLLQSQFDTLEEPTPSEAIYMDASQPIQVIIQSIISYLE